MFQMRGLGATNLDPYRPGAEGALPKPTDSPWGGGGSGGTPPVIGYQMPVLQSVRGLTVGGLPKPAMPPSCPQGFAWGMLKNGQSGCFPTGEQLQNPTPGTTVAVGAEPGTPAAYEMAPPWWQRPIVLIAGLGLAVGLGILIAKKL